MENVKQLLILNRNLTIKKILSINKVIPVQDIISPQKTTFEIIKSKDIVIGDLIVLKRENIVEYIGIIQDVETDKTTKLASYPLISITDIDCVMGNLNGNVFNWIKDVFEYNLVNTLTDSNTSDYVDNLLALPFEFKDNTSAKTLKLEVNNGNFFDVLIDIFKKTGIYLSFNLQYVQGKVSNILVNVNIADENTKILLRHDNPLIFEEPVIENSQNQNVNKIIFVPSDDNTTADAKNVYVFYLLDNNTVTTNPNGTDTGKRLNGVKQTIQEYSDDDYTKGLQVIAEETMLGNTLDHQITIKILQNSGFDVQLYDRVSYIDTQKTYDTYVTRIENYNDKYKTIKLGVLRTTLTDKIKNLEKLLAKKQLGVVNGSGGGSGGSNVNVYDGLNSTSSTDALSANQGRILNSKIDSEVSNINTNINDAVVALNKLISALQTSKADKSEIPDVSNFITRAVNDLENYYTKSQTYTQAEVNSLVSLIPKFKFEVVTTLPESPNETTIYLKTGNLEGQNNLYTEFIYVNGKWEKFGEQQLDLSNYTLLTDFNKLVMNTTPIGNSSGGFKGGGTTSSPASDVGTGGAIGKYATADGGGSVGYSAVTGNGGSVGANAYSGKGFAGGYNAKAGTSAISDNIQLGAGTNLKNKTLQVYDDNIYDANTQTLTVKNIELDGKDINDKIEQSSSSFMPIGLIFSSAIPQTDARVHLLDGSTIPQSGIYADFANLINSLKNDGYDIAYETNAEFEADVSATGNCGKFVIDNDAGTIRLPKITTFIQGLSDLTNLTDIGSKVEAGLPNIKASYSAIMRDDGVTESVSGAFSVSTPRSRSWSGASGDGVRKLSFNANKYNSIYSDSVNTVQPPATRYPYYIVLASGYKSSSQVNIDNYVTELNGKLAKAEIKRYPIETYNDGNTKYTIYNDGFKTCSGIMWTNQSVSSSNELNITLTLPVEFSGNYIVVYNGSNYTIPLGSWSHSTQSCLLRFGGYQGGRTLSRVDWYVEGY